MRMSAILLALGHVAATHMEGAQARAVPAANDVPAGIAAAGVAPRSAAPIRITSRRIDNGGRIPLSASSYGKNVSLPVAWSRAPRQAQSFVVIMEDPDAPGSTPFVHWVAYDIPASSSSLPEDLPKTPVLNQPRGMRQGETSAGTVGYFGPKPPPGDPPHRYFIQVFALDGALDVRPGATRDEVLSRMRGHVLAMGELVGTFQRK